MLMRVVVLHKPRLRTPVTKTVMERKKTTLSLQRRLDLITVAELNPSKMRKTIADEFGVSPATVTGIMKDKEKYKRHCFRGEIDLRKLRVRPPKHTAVDSALLKWFTHARSKNKPISGPIMKATAEEISRQLGISDWMCSDGWLDRFKKRYNISYKMYRVRSRERQAAEELQEEFTDRSTYSKFGLTVSATSIIY